jgi:site-specific DNA-cytosine methylase
MWEHRNAVLHNTQLESSRMIQHAEINDAIMKLYEKVNTYSAEDCWCFNLPLALWLRKSLRSRRRWLVNTRILVNKSEQFAMIGQMMMNQYYPHLLSARTVTNRTLERIASAPHYFQMSLLNLWNPQQGAGWKVSPSHLLWLGIILLYLRWCRWPSYHSWLKM